MSTITATVQLRRDTAANWTSNNPTLLAGEVGFETDTKRAKLGDGATAWNSLAYIDPSWLQDDSVTNAKLSNMAQATIKGRQAGSGTGDPEDLTASQARTALALGTAAQVNTGTGSGDVPTITQADARYELASDTSRASISTPFTTNSASLVDVTGFNITLQANSVYQIYSYVLCQSTNVNTGFGNTFSFTNSPTKIHLLVQQQRTTAAPITTALSQCVTSDDVTTQTTVGAANTDYFVLIRGMVITGANASVMQARIIRGGSANNISLQSAYIIAHKIS